ncbi:stage VI sporulation protein D [Robertmurraya sp. DFI.2.37]|uniref:stage VI sporulation protein D n=1 Tax=Robertmurraya sp. DFI.2.37 TaxID=3031819 RepID=UPI0012470FED|nr:stage VI sporulation protein D [Robertmurraya sp. DFI.2.37]MDF1506899.1 stage VI sporulation protein D [Robertmurraya sp. DFI.2.37]
MSEGNESFLRFSLEESVWFQKGQEVAELITISLDPNITIHENDDYVTIEGELQLSGEYKRKETEAEVEEEIPLSPKFVQQIENREEGITQFSHRFPVDITIPVHRIANIYDLDVEIESFDYLFPEQSCMKLTADLTITGLKSDEPEVQAEPSELELAYREEEPPKQELKLEEVEEVQPAEETVLPANDLFAPFVAEARKSPEEEQNEAEPAPSLLELDKAPTLQVYEQESEAIKTVPDVSFAPQRYEFTPNEPATAQLEEVEQAEHEYESPADEESSSSSSEEVAKKKKKKSKKQGISITEFLARKEDEEAVARLKVCIVQSGDTLDVIAERYEISTQQLLKFNHLEVNQDVFEGQVLYIPATVTHN